MRLLNDETAFFGPELHIPEPTVMEMYGAIRRMKNNRAPGQDAITAELIQERGRCLWKGIYQLILSVRGLWKGIYQSILSVREKEIMPKE
jgi:hypothetical protein